MACACKVNRDLAILRKRYGVGDKKENDETHYNFGYIVKNLAVILIMMLIFPLLIVFTICTMVKSKRNNEPIHLDKIFRIGDKNHDNSWVMKVTGR